MREHGRVDHQQLPAAVRLAAEQNPAEAHSTVDLQRDHRQLPQGAVGEKCTPQLGHGQVLGTCRLLLQEHPLVIDTHAALRDGLAEFFQATIQVLDDRLEGLLRVLRQLQVSVVHVAMGRPLLG